MSATIGERIRDNWIKILLLVLGAVVLGSIAVVMIDPGLGTPEESQRARHPSGFSFIPPRGWGATVMYGGTTLAGDTLRVSPERSTGRQPSIAVIRYRNPITPYPDALPYTFQNQPALLAAGKLPHYWSWTLQFQRDGRWYSIALSFPLETDVEHSEYMPFINSFRVEQPMNVATAPATSAATLPAATMP